ncbi:MAG: LysR family transcriptional regulator [Oscillospiraceae bacterium]|nr:LysR family transcriptional regulator [Oscillospiraceae bacterium]
MLSFEYIRYFLEACDCGSIQAASKKLFLSAQGLGAGIQRLENSLGLKLLVRSKSGVTPTQFGKEFYLYASRLAEDMDQLEQFCQEYRKSQASDTLIGVVGDNKFASSITLCAELYSRDHPDRPTNVSAISFESSESLQEALRAGELDAAWVFHREEQPGFIYRRIDEYSPLVLICSADCSLAGRSSVSLQDLGALRFIQAGRADSITELVSRLFTEAGVRQDIFMYSTENIMIGKLIDDGIAAILLRDCYAPAVVKHCTRCAVVPLEPEVLVASSLISRAPRSRHSVQSKFFDYMADYLHQHLFTYR